MSDAVTFNPEYAPKGAELGDWVYIDGKYMLDVYKKHGSNLSLRSIPKLTLVLVFILPKPSPSKIVAPFKLPLLK